MRSEIILKDGRVYHLGVPIGALAPNLLFVGDPQRALTVANQFDQIVHQFQNREYLTVCGRYKDQAYSVIGTGIGTDNVEIALIEAYGLLCLDLGEGSPRFDPTQIKLIRVGTSGGIQPQSPPGTLVVSEYAIGLDSTGLYYDHPAADAITTQLEKQVHSTLENQMNSSARFKGKIFPYAAKSSSLLSEGLMKHAGLAGVSAEKGITVTAPGFYGPSGRYISGIVNSLPDIKECLSEINVNQLSILNMEMESSLMFHLSRFLGIKASTICVAISAVSTDTELIDYQPHIENAISIALETLHDTTL